MCGIVGCNFNTDKFIKAVELISHRGPDNLGYVNFENFSFGHTRLAIIDLNEEANQPMSFDDLIITFNGEIYNYQKLIKEENLNCITKSDTEVIIRLYQKYERAFLNKLEGMFSFCIFDKKKKSFFCVRDRFGKKPFYFYFKEKKFIYASEIKSILKLLDSTPSFNQNAFSEYLTFSTPINGNTFYEGIEKLEAGHFIYLDSTTYIKEKYYDIDKLEVSEQNEKDIVGKNRRLTY